MKKVYVMQQKWDYLIVLDACRYDYFERLWQDYLPGQLEKRISVGTATKQWRNNSFPDYYDDVVYISANPYINSVMPVKGFLGTEHFYKVYDLWMDSWDEEKGTILPDIVTKRAKEIIKSHPDKRAIIHYMQPHEPYIGNTVPGPGFERPTSAGFRQGVNVGTPPNHIVRKTLEILSGLFYWFGIRGNYLIWKIRELLEMTPAGPMDAVRRKYDEETLRKAYEENLKIVLGYIAELIEKLSGRIVVTADHGEMLGENNKFCHWSRATEKQLREVPWLIIDKDHKVTKDEIRNDKIQRTSANKTTIAKRTKQAEKKICEKLRSLGYID